MQLHFYKCKSRNFGDDLNAWLWERLVPEAFDDDASTRLCGIGTLIGNNLSKEAQWIVFGSGVGYLPPPEDFNSSRWNVLCVRGPLSAEVLGLPADKAITDGAILLALLPEYAPLPETERHGIVFMPHHLAKEEGRWREVCDLAGIEFLDPEDDDRKTLQRIRTARLVIADAMHAAIVADTLRVPWIPVVTSNEINTFKWLDWTMSMHVPYRPVILPQSTRGEAVRNWFLPFRGRGYFLNGGDEEIAVRKFRKLVRLARPPWRIVYRKLVGVAYLVARRAVAAISAIEALAIKRRAGDGDLIPPRLRHAAEALQSAAQGVSFLSSSEVFQRRKAQMGECLDHLKCKTPRST